jgi:hypothetical protein
MAYIDGGAMSTITHQARIVVGVAATHCNQAALTLAMQEASLRGSTLEILTAWQWASTRTP